MVRGASSGMTLHSCRSHGCSGRATESFDRCLAAPADRSEHSAGCSDPPPGPSRSHAVMEACQAYR